MHISAIVRNARDSHEASVASGSDAEVAKLLRETDAVAEIHNTVRAGVAVRLEAWESSMHSAPAPK